MLAGFLADIREHPWDDVPRLILADWLADHEQEAWAAYIRHAVEFDLSRMLRSGGYLRFADKQIFRVPYGRGRGTDGRSREKWLVRHGLVEAVETTCQDWLKHGSSMVQQHPLIWVTLLDKEPQEYASVWYWRREDTQKDERIPHSRSYLLEQQRRSLPAELFACVRAGFLHSDNYARHYCGRQSALKHLSEGCLAWAREQAAQEAVYA